MPESPPSAPEAPDAALPSDPMWRRFRELHPEVTLVLLPEPPPSSVTPEASSVEEEVLRAEGVEAERLLRLAARSLMLDGAATTTWISPTPGLLHARLALTAAAPSDLPAAETIAFQLSRLGWDTVVRPSRAVATVWVEGSAHGRSLRFSAVGDVALLVVTSRTLPVEDAVRTRLEEESRG